MNGDREVYTLDRPGAWGEFGLGVLMVVPTVALAVAFTIPGVFLQVFPNAPKERDPLAIVLLAALGLAIVGGGVFFLARAIRTLRDRAPKLELRGDVLVDHRGRKTIPWPDVFGTGYSIERTGNRLRRAVLTLSVRTVYGSRELTVDVGGLSASPEAIIGRVQYFAGRA